MTKQTFTTGQVLTAAQMTSLQQTAMGGGSTTAKTASYVLVAADAGTVVQMNAAGATTITVNTALFAAGDSVQIQNVGSGVCTVTAGTATVSTAGSLALSQYEGGQLYFNTTSAALFFDIVQTAASSGLTLITRQTFTSVATTTTTFDSVFSSTYKTYLIVLEKFFAATAANDPYLQLRYAGPNTYNAALYQSSTATIPCGTATQTITGYANATQWVLALSSASSAENFGGEYWLYGVGTSSIEAQMNGSGSSGYEGSNVLAYLASTAQTYTGFILSSSSSNISGTVAVYGLASA